MTRTESTEGVETAATLKEDCAFLASHASGISIEQWSPIANRMLGAAARIEALENALRSAIADLVDMSNARWSEYEGTEDDLVGGYREALGEKP